MERQLRVNAGIRAVKFEERMSERNEGKILNECCMEIKKCIGKQVWKQKGTERVCM